MQRLSCPGRSRFPQARVFDSGSERSSEVTRAVAYARVSSDGQAEKNTIENQLVAIRDWAESRDIELVEEFLDEGVSGSIPFDERPEAQRLLDSLDSIDTVIVYCPDRLGRDTQYALEAMRE